MNSIIKNALIGIPIVILVYLLYLWSSGPGAYDDFAKCLTEKGAVLYGTDECKYCQQQKASFGKSFGYIDYRNCNFNMQECDNMGVNGYPTWRIDNTNYQGGQSLEELARLAGCSLE